MGKTRLLRITTVPISLQILLRGQFQFMQAKGYEVFTVSADGPELPDLKNQGIDHTIVPFTRTITPWQDLVCLLKLISLIRELRPDIVHTHTPKAGLLGMVAARVCMVKIRLHTVAGLPYQESRGWRKAVLRLAETATYAFASRVYPNSRGLEDFMKSEFPKYSDKYHVIGRGSSNGVDTAYFSPGPNSQSDLLRGILHISKEDYVYCFVGRMVKDKGLTELVNAFVEIAEKRNIWLLLVGHFEQDLDPLPEPIRKQISDHPRIIHAGFQSDIRTWVQASDVLVLPSYREGFPNVLLQAGCLQKPCIATDINGCNEIIQDHVTGLIVPVKNVRALSEAMVELYNGKEWGRLAGIEARKFISKNFEQSYIWNEILNEYQTLVHQLD